MSTEDFDMDLRERDSPSTHPMSEDESAADRTEDNAETNASLFGDDDEEEEEGIVLDPKNSERYTWRDIRTKTEREIWRPGDGDGDRRTDYWDRTAPLNNIKDRWKLYQSSLGPIKHEHNEPPKYVFLDDRACYEVMQSNIPRASLGKFWPHDFGLSGKLRDRRPHRGRGSIGDQNAEGNDQFDYCQLGVKNARYYFTGEKDYAPIIYRSEELSAEIAKKLEKKRKGWAVRNTKGDPKLRGHNQFTPKDMLVKYGAPSTSTGKKKKKKADHKVPDWLLDKPKLSDGYASSLPGAPDRDFSPTPTATEPQQMTEVGTEDGYDSHAAKRRRIGGHKMPAEAAHSSSPSQMFPFHRPTAGHQTVPPGFYNPLAPIANGYHQESTCPYTQSRTYASQLEKDLTAAQEKITEQKEKIAEMEQAGTEKNGVIEQLTKELQDLRWGTGR